MEKGRFEESWKRAFDGAEAEPNGSVWTNVELELEKAAGGRMRQRVLFYKMLAAASLVFAMGIAGVYYLVSTDGENPVTALSGPDSEPQAALPEIATSMSERNPNMELVTPQLPAQENPDRPVASTRKTNHTRAGLQTGAEADPRVLKEALNTIVPSEGVATTDNTLADQPSVAMEAQQSSSTETQQVGAVSPQGTAVIPSEESQESTADPGMLLLAQMKDEEKKYHQQEKRASATEKVWTSVGAGAGTFNPNTPSTTYMRSSSLSGSNSGTGVSKPTPGSSYSFGVQLGGKIADRFMLLGGLSYLTQNALYTSNVVAFEANTAMATLDALAYTGNQSVSTSPYNVTSNLQYLSVPLQVGYLVVDRGFGFQLNGGLASDFFVQNTLTPDVDYVERVSQGAGDDSPYRTVNFTGLVGTEISYRFGDRYRIALNPGIRYALNSIYKSEVSSEVSPITYDVALRFRYILR